MPCATPKLQAPEERCSLMGATPPQYRPLPTRYDPRQRAQKIPVAISAGTQCALTSRSFPPLLHDRVNSPRVLLPLFRVSDANGI